MTDNADADATPHTETERAETASQRTVTASVGALSELDVGHMRVAQVGERRVAVIRTASGVYALDNACPHQGYGLVTGALNDETVVCQWHNWKFDVRTGACTQGEEDVACHRVEVTDGEIFVSVTERTNEEILAATWPSLRSGIESNYIGQIARDTARLLAAGAPPEEIVWEAVRYGAPRMEWGPDHETAMAADCLTVALERAGADQALAVVQGISGLAEEARGRAPHVLPAPDASADFQQAVEDEDIDGLRATTLALLADGVDPAALRHEFIDAASRHHLGYGHGIIYVQKAFELLEHVGWDKAAELLPHTASSTAWMTREDLLPYMSKAMKRIDRADLDALAEAEAIEGWSDPGLVDSLLTLDEAPIDVAIEAVLDGAGILGLINALSIASSRRLLRHSLDVEFAEDHDFNWLAITHALTMTNAVRWAWTVDPGPHVARLALFATWLLYDSSRGEQRRGVSEEMTASASGGSSASAASLASGIRFRDTQGVLDGVARMSIEDAGNALIDASLQDQSGAFIVVVHQIKLSLAAKLEAAATGSHLPLLAAARYLSSPRNERFVSSNVRESLDFVETGRPPKR